jgi:hypothetical protein
MNDDLERMWKEATVAEFKIYRHLPGGTKETTNPLRIASLSAEV